MGAKDKRHEMDRIIVGNQIAIMRALQSLLPLNGPQRTSLNIRVHDMKEAWRHEFGEEVGFSATLGDRPKDEAA